MSDFDKEIRAIGPRRHRIAIVHLVNEERRKRDLPALRTAPSLQVSARAWARTMSRRTEFDHGTGKQSFPQRVARFPFVVRARVRGNLAVGENLGTGVGPQSTPRRVVERWMASAGHRANILGDWKYTAVWSTPDDPLRPGRQANAVTVVQQFARR